ncbi:MAG: Xaa-Pro peptidase family protein [Actinomycetota bacterium]|nr:Xaa-Pro peptidase family protein [Actinomycetota bacterium]
MPIGRRAALRRLLVDETCGLLVTSLPNIRYLTGFSGSNAALFISRAEPGDDIICTDGRYLTQVKEECPDLPVHPDRSCAMALVNLLAARGVTRIAVEDNLPIVIERQMAKALSLVPTSGLTEQLRTVKDAGEIELLVRAGAITAQAMGQLFGEIRVGMSEIAVARRLEQLFGELGADDRAFETIVATGSGSASPHHQPTSRTLAAGDLLVIDAGAKVFGYHADMTRTVVVGAEPVAWQVQIHSAVLAAQAAGVNACAPGVCLDFIDLAARSVIEAAGFGDAFGHGLGHGVGLEIHEAPMIKARSTGSILANTPVTIEPGIYLPAQGGVRIEDTLVVQVGSNRVLTEMSRELTVVG